MAEGDFAGLRSRVDARRVEVVGVAVASGAGESGLAGVACLADARRVVDGAGVSAAVGGKVGGGDGAGDAARGVAAGPGVGGADTSERSESPSKTSIVEESVRST